MPKRLGVLAVHGMGETPIEFAEEMENILAYRLGPEAWSNIHFGTVYYQHLLQSNQSRVWTNMLHLSSAKLRWKQLRKFMLYSFSDPVSLEHKHDAENSVYRKTQHVIADSLKVMKDDLEGDSPSVVVIAQSLGGQVISNYIWDSQRDGGIWRPGMADSLDLGSMSESEKNYLALKTMPYLYTTGCNIPIFVAGFDRVVPFRKDLMHPGFQWENYYDRDDVLGWPLMPLSDEYANLVNDHEIDSGGILTSSTPFSHVDYWTDSGFLVPLIQSLNRLLESS